MNTAIRPVSQPSVISNNRSWRRVPTPIDSGCRENVIDLCDNNDKNSRKRQALELVESSYSKRRNQMECSVLPHNSSRSSTQFTQFMDDPMILELIQKGATIYESYEDIAPNAPVVPIGDGRWVNISIQLERDNAVINQSSNSSSSSTQTSEILTNTEIITPLIVPSRDTSNGIPLIIPVHPPPSFTPNQDQTTIDSLIGRNMYLVNRIIGLELEVRKAETYSNQVRETTKRRRRRLAANRKRGKERAKDIDKRVEARNTVNMLRGNMINNISYKVISDDLALVDSGSNLTHAMQDRVFTTLDRNNTTTVEIADGNSIYTEGKGLIGKYEASYTPSFNQNICSVSTLTGGGEVVCFSPARGAFTIKEKDFDYNQKVNRQFTKINEMYYIKLSELKEKPKVLQNPIPIKSLTMASTHPDGSIILWHQRLHMSNDYIKRLIQLQLVHGMNIND